jgi:hypothetical protein
LPLWLAQSAPQITTHAIVADRPANENFRIAAHLSRSALNRLKSG